MHISYIHIKGTTSVENTAVTGAAANNGNKKVIFKTCAPFIDCIIDINNTQVDNAKEIDAVMSTYDLIKYSNNFSKTSGSLCQYYRDESIKNDSGFVRKCKLSLKEEGGRAGGFYKISKKKLRSPEDHRPKYFMVQ